LRIAYLYQYHQSLERFGGGRSYEFGRRLVERGHEVHMITTDRWETRTRGGWQVEEEAGMRVHRLPVPYANTMSHPRRMQAFARFAMAAGIRAARVHPEVVFATSTPLTIVVPGLVAARLSRARFVFEVRDLWPELPLELGFLRNPIAKHLAVRLAEAGYRHADFVVALSSGMAAGVVRHGYPPGQIAVIPNACDPSLFSPSPAAVTGFRSERTWLGDRPLVVYTGTFGRVNGVDYLVRLATEVRPLNPEIRFLLVGDGAQRNAVRDLAQRLGVLDRTLFLSTPVPRSRLPVILGAATIATSVFIPFPGLEHNSANKFFDSLAAERPIAINHGGWQADLLNRTHAGLELDPFDLPAAARELVQRLEDPDWLKAAGDAASALARGRFARDRLFDHFERVLTGTAGLTAPDPADVATSRAPTDQRHPDSRNVTADGDRRTRAGHGPA
jgi:glycosyltransferase involved in cell wall biosynthesis